MSERFPGNLETGIAKPSKFLAKLKPATLKRNLCAKRVVKQLRYAQ
jgi:hypothetical protein